ncbi:ester cyclase [Paraflavitalea speifideaquila]|uniref:ester cyclase n=1 Tax=Paraflavitalea speifideaquila TaxID=3076558 RepID=UPI0028E755BD|nr:ester cyclase [Paraflavitalea speifideiaquila]
MSIIEQNKATIQGMYEQALNTHRFELLGEYVAPEYTGPGGLKGAAGFGDPLRPLIIAFPDFHWQLDELVAEGDKVMIRWTVTGTHLGPLNGLAGTGKKVRSAGMGVFGMKDGKVTNGQVLTDRLGFCKSWGCCHWM